MPPTSAISLAMRMSARPEPYCSMQPRAPHPQGSPSGTMRMWPSSAPAPKPPRKSAPPLTIAPPDARADRQHRHVADVAAGAEPELGPPGGVGVVVDRDIEREPREQPLAQGLVAPRDVGRVVHGRLLGIDEAGRGDAGGDHLVAGGELGDHLDDGFDDRVGVPGLRRNPTLLDDLARLADDRARDLGPADVNPDRMHDREV